MDDFWEKIKTNIKFKGGTSLGFSIYITSIISGIFGVAIAPILGAEDYGIVSYYFAIASIAFAFSSLGIGNVLMVYIPKGVKLMSTTSFITLIFGIIASIVVYLIFNEISISILILGLGIFEVAIHELLAKRMYHSFTKYTLVQKAAFVILALSLYFVWGPTGMILGHALSFLVVIPRLYFGFKESKIRISLLTSRRNFILNNYFSHLSRISYTYLDRLIIFPIFGFATLGNYELSLQILAVAYIFPVIVYRYVLPRDAVNESTKKYKQPPKFVN